MLHIAHHKAVVRARELRHQRLLHIRGVLIFIHEYKIVLRAHFLRHGLIAQRLQRAMLQVGIAQRRQLRLARRTLFARRQRNLCQPPQLRAQRLDIPQGDGDVHIPQHRLLQRALRVSAQLFHLVAHRHAAHARGRSLLKTQNGAAQRLEILYRRHGLQRVHILQKRGDAVIRRVRTVHRLPREQQRALDTAVCAAAQFIQPARGQIVAVQHRIEPRLRIGALVQHLEQRLRHCRHAFWAAPVIQLQQRRV